MDRPPAGDGGRPRRPLLLSVASALVLGVLLGTVAGQAAAEPPLCREVARRVGLDFHGRLGRTAAPSAAAERMQGAMGNGAAVGDADGDGDLDVYLLGQAGRGSRYFRNESDRRGMRFVEATRAAGLRRDGLDRVAHFADLDGDLDLDLVVISDRDPEGRLPPSVVFRNRGDGTFRPVPPDRSGLDPEGVIVGGASLGDHDGDGLLDIYISYWLMELGRPTPSGDPRGELPGENRLYRNLGDLRFDDVSRAAGLSGFARDSFSSVFADLDGDADADLYLAVDHRPDVLWANEGGRFRDVSTASGVGHVGNDMGVAVADLEGDGWPDLYLTNISDPAGVFGTGGAGSILLRGSAGSAGGVLFGDGDPEGRLADAGWGWGAAFTDLDLDGRLDLVVAQGMDEFTRELSPLLLEDRSRLFQGGEGGAWRRLDGHGCEMEGDQRALIAFDADRDGDEDILMTEVDGPVRLLENRARGRSVTVIPGPGSAGVGAWVSVEVGRDRVGRPILAGGSYLAGPPAEAVFGLGGRRRADLVRVTWPDGRTSEHRDVPAGVLRVEPPPAAADAHAPDGAGAAG